MSTKGGWVDKVSSGMACMDEKEAVVVVFEDTQEHNIQDDKEEGRILNIDFANLVFISLLTWGFNAPLGHTAAKELPKFIPTYVYPSMYVMQQRIKCSPESGHVKVSRTLNWDP